MQLPRVVNLGESIVLESVIADCSMSKQALSKILGTSRPTIWRYDEIAYWAVPDYKQDYPELPKEQWLIRKSKRDRQVHLSPYQIWVISAIQICFKHYHRESPVKTYIEKNSYVFSRARYEARLRQLAKEIKTA